MELIRQGIDPSSKHSYTGEDDNARRLREMASLDRKAADDAKELMAAPSSTMSLQDEFYLKSSQSKRSDEISAGLCFAVDPIAAPLTKLV